jgi:hypothetical protein
LPNLFVSDMPGFLSGRFSGFQGEAVYIRNVLLPEQFFLTLEDKALNKLGNEGLSKLYGVGKRHGYRFCALAKLPKSDVKFSTKLLFEFIEACYADKIDLNIDLDQKILTIDTKGFVVTRFRGGGISVGVGACAGIWGYFLNDFDMSECGVIHIEGDHYILVAGPIGKLREAGIDSYEYHGTPDIGDLKAYKDNNQPLEVIPPGIKNLDMLVREKVLSNEKGSLKFSLQDIPLVTTEISYSFDLESTLGGDFVYEVAKESFTLVGKAVPHQEKRDEFLADLLTATGFGIVTVERGADSTTFRFEGTPWYYSAKDSGFPVLRGAVEGFLEGQGGMPAKASITKSELSNNCLTIAIELAY